MTKFNYSEALSGLDASLRATNVLSEDYRAAILAFAIQAHADGYNLAKAQAEATSAEAADDRDGINPFVPSSLVVTTEPDAIPHTLNDVVAQVNSDPDGEQAAEVYIDYVDRYGDRTQDRAVKLVSLSTGVLTCLDVAKDEYRQFIVNRITKVAVRREAA